MMDRIAVILRGHLRTWNYVKPAVFDFYDAIAHNVEYYIVTWETDLFQNLIQDFANRNLIAAIQLPDANEWTSWTGPGWQSYNIVPYKKERETQIKYDAVFDTRPDIIYSLIPDTTVIPPEPMTIYTSGFTNQCGNGTDANDQERYYIGLRDHFCMMQSQVYDILSNRYLLQTRRACHAELKRICFDNHINTNSIHWAKTEITRPDAIINRPNPRTFFNYKSPLRWHMLSTDEKATILNNNNISPSDYITSSVQTH
jgi:hypothetical protein